MERQRRIYSLEFKLKVVELSNQRGNLVSVANELNASTDNIKRWKKEFNKGKLTVKPVRDTTDSSHKYPVVDNRLNRKFTVDRENEAWVSDITYVRTNQGWLYFKDSN